MRVGDRRFARLLLGLLCALAVSMLGSDRARAGAYVFAGEGNGVDLITHPNGYNGFGGVVTVDVCIDPASPNASLMEAAVENVVNTYQSLIPTTGNLKSGSSNDVPSGEVDFESVALHEVGHCLGMAHPNLASESGLGSPQNNATKSTDGADDTFDVSAGPDGLTGSADDLRGDDVNLHWFRTADNNPFGVGAIVDATTYSRDLADLPPGDVYAVNGDRSVASTLGFPDTEAVMQQLTFFDEAQRSITGDEVATLRLAMAGLDEIEGTSDDYTINLRYRGLRSSCDVKLEFDDAQTSFAVCATGGNFLGGHTVITSANVYFNTGYAWHFTSTVRPTCGNGLVEGAEECDDGAGWAGDGCDSVCQEEAGWSCSGEPSACVEVCGDGLQTSGEACDDGNTSSGDCCSGTCQLESPGSSCDDGDPCALNDTCDGAGSCQPGEPIDCDDGVFCNGTEVCTTGVGCEPGTPRVIDDGIGCTWDSCDEVQAQIVHIPNSLLCDDGAYCNGLETCDPLLDCQVGQVPDPDDGVACTADACDEVLDTVTNTPDDLLCDDADACTADACDTLGGCSHEPVVCDDADPCTADLCDAELGCMHQPLQGCSAVPGASSGGHAVLAVLILAMGSLILARMTVGTGGGIMQHSCATEPIRSVTREGKGHLARRGQSR